MRDSNAWPFNCPVDVVKLKIPDYYQIIKKPMDLGTIWKKLNYKNYVSILEFADDVRLVFRNAKTYNRPGLDIWDMAEYLSDLFEEKYASINMLQFLDDVGGDPKILFSHMKESVQNLEMIKQKNKEELMNLLKNHDKSPPLRSQEGLNKSDLVYKEKVVIRNFFNKLSTDYMNGVKLIFEETNHPILKSSSEIFELDIDKIDTLTLRRMEAYMNDCKSIMTTEELKLMEDNEVTPNHIVIINPRTIQNAIPSSQNIDSTSHEIILTTPDIVPINQNINFTQIIAPINQNINSTQMPTNLDVSNVTQETNESSTSSESSESSSDSESEIDLFQVSNENAIAPTLQRTEYSKKMEKIDIEPIQEINETVTNNTPEVFQTTEEQLIIDIGLNSHIGSSLDSQYNQIINQNLIIPYYFYQTTCQTNSNYVTPR